MKAQAESRQTLVLGVYAREFPGGLLKLDPAFAYAEPPSLTSKTEPSDICVIKTAEPPVYDFREH